MSGLSVKQLRDIYTSRATNWKYLGDPDLSIRPFAVAPQRTTALSPILAAEAGATVGENVTVLRDYTSIFRQVAARIRTIRSHAYWLLSSALTAATEAAGQAYSLMLLSAEGQQAISYAGFVPLH